MKYLCLLYYDTDAFARLPSAELEAIGPACRPRDAALKATGRLVTQGSLSLPDTGTSIRPATGAPALSKGPFIAGPRQAGAFLFIDADTEAIAVASKRAAANVGAELGFGAAVRACVTYESPPG